MIDGLAKNTTVIKQLKMEVLSVKTVQQAISFPMFTADGARIVPRGALFWATLINIHC